jgi:hypothetical protein
MLRRAVAKAALVKMVVPDNYDNLVVDAWVNGGVLSG